jgi:hypothetical protein
MYFDKKKKEMKKIQCQDEKESLYIILESRAYASFR